MRRNVYHEKERGWEEMDKMKDGRKEGRTTQIAQEQIDRVSNSDHTIAIPETKITKFENGC